jgi:hypothetical protein
LPCLAAPVSPGSWIWHPEEQPDHLGVPAVTRYFRKTVDLPTTPDAAYLKITADDEFRLWVNGSEIGSGDSWEELYRFDLTRALRPGHNVIAVAATNTLPGPAGLIAWGEIVLPDGASIPLRTDAGWKVSEQGPNGWATTEFDDSAWSPSVVLADAQGGPWRGQMRQTGGDPATHAFLVQATLSKLQLVPRPRQVKLLDGMFPLVSGKATCDIRVAASLKDSYAVEQIVRAVGLMGDGLRPQVTVSESLVPNSRSAAILLMSPVPPAIKSLFATTGIDVSSLKPQGYAIDFTSGPHPSAIIVGADAAGLIYGSSTFIQLIHRDGANLLAQRASIVDWPAFPLRGPRSVGTSKPMADWCAFYKMNSLVDGFDWAQPLPASLKQKSDMLSQRGIMLLPECHPGGIPDKPFIFTNPAHRQELLSRVQEGINMGLPALGFMVDDIPNAPESPADEAKYGKGLVGLGKAQMEMMAEVGKAAGNRIRIFFCPRVYYDPNQQNVYPTQPREEERVYISLVGTLPRNVELWTTQPKPSYVQSLNRAWGRKPFIYHNLFYTDLADMKLYFEPYPAPSPQQEKTVAGWTAAGSGGRYAREWQVNLLDFAANVWNPEQPVGLNECFQREYGERAAPFLAKYTLGIGGHLSPGVPIMGDVWDQPDDYACVKMSFGFAGRLRLLKSEPQAIARLRKLSEQARTAAEMSWSGSGLEPDEVEVFQLNARRLQLGYSAYADILTVEMDVAAQKNADDAAIAQRAVRDSGEIREIIGKLLLSQNDCGDWALYDRAQALLARLK